MHPNYKGIYTKYKIHNTQGGAACLFTIVLYEVTQHIITITPKLLSKVTHKTME